jgi:hypothetical protein
MEIFFANDTRFITDHQLFKGYKPDDDFGVSSPTLIEKCFKTF